MIRMYLLLFQETLTVVSNRAGIKPILVAIQTLRTTGNGSKAPLILVRFD